MSILAKSAARAGLIALMSVVVAACSSPATLPPNPPAASTRPTAVVPSSTPSPGNPPALPTPAASLTPLPTPVPATATPLPSATLDAWRFLPACGEAATAISLSSLPAATNQPGWKRYTQPDYGLSVAVPPDWWLAVGAHSLCLAPSAAPTVILTVGFRGPIESVTIQRSGVAAGDIITRGSVIILGQKVDRNVLVYQSQDKAILYNSAAEISTPHLALTASLDDYEPDYDAVALPLSLQATADQIVASLSAGPPLTSWPTYVSSAFHVSVQYPSNWHLDRSGDAIYSSPDGFFNITAAASMAPIAQIACQITLDSSQTHNGLEPQFGHQPTMQIVQIDHQPACLILPSADQLESYRGLALLFVDYPASIARGDILQFWADKDHIRDLGARLKFIRTP